MKVLGRLFPPETARTVWTLILQGSHLRAIWVLATVIMMALAEVLGIGGVFIFMQAAAEPATIHSSATLSKFYALSGFKTDLQFLVALGVLAIVLIVVRNGCGALEAGTQLNFITSLHRDLANRLLRRYLGQEIAFMHQRHSAMLQRNIMQELGLLVSGFVMNLLMLAGNLLICCAIVGFLFYNQPLIGPLAIAIVGGAYGAIYLALRGRVAVWGKRRMEAGGQRFKNVSEALASFKETKILGREGYFLDRFSEPNRVYFQAQFLTGIYQQMPRFGMEVVAFGGLMALVLVLLLKGGSLSELIGALSLLGIAMYRLAPRLDKLLTGFIGLRFNRIVFEEITDVLRAGQPDWDGEGPDVEPLPFTDEIRLDEVTLKYAAADGQALAGVSARIPIGSSTAFVGATGAGKSTLIEILTGLLEPTSGSFTVDGVPVTRSNRRHWRANIGYVPQMVTLIDDTVRSNIAFGVPENEIDDNMVRKAAKAARLHDFVTGDLPQGYNTLVGENGVRLSGGQRQRLAIARALYFKPSLLVLDEATSALDTVTESEVMEAIYALGGEITIVVIAHRLTTVQKCERIYVLDRGKIVGEGSYATLVRRNAAFKALAEAAD